MDLGHILGAALIFASPIHENSEAMHGDWARGDGIAKVRIAPCGNSLCATNFWIKPGTKDEKVGDVLVLTVTPHSSQVWRGHAFDPQRNLHLRMEVKMAGNSMTSRGCVLGGLICKQASWKRI